ncbi:MAG TPA: hypothetical protein VHK91_10820, partial [Flavisolibacter sp.]|nr:hypothetical protein [Flavisolibacter sp.]
MKTYGSIVLFLLIFFTACRKEFEPPVTPGIDWDLFNTTPATPLSVTARSAMEGIYRVTAASDRFGDQVALKWSYDVNNADTTFYCSLFCQTDITHLILQGKRSGDSILLSGYWRKMINTQTGTVRLVIPYEQGARQLSGNTPVINKDSIVLTGVM